METNKFKKQLLLFLAYISVTLVLFMEWNEKKEQEVSSIEKKYDQLQEENLHLVDQREYLLKNYTAVKEDNLYHQWKMYEAIASKMVKESNGKFKMSWAIYLSKQAENYQIDPFLVFELLKVETGGTFNPKLIGPKTRYGHAYGLAQFMKNTAPWVANMGNLPYDDTLLFDPYYSMQLSLIYLDFLYSKYENWDEALTAYNRGMGGLETFVRRNGHAQSSYAITIQTNAQDHIDIIASR